jgi:hypothetical protein
MIGNIDRTRLMICSHDFPPITTVATSAPIARSTNASIMSNSGSIQVGSRATSSWNVRNESEYGASWLVTKWALPLRPFLEKPAQFGLQDLAVIVLG